jgi:hypothetical protein
METALAVPHRVKVRLGIHEFEAEGTEESVNKQYEMFLQTAQLVPAAPIKGTNGRAASDPADPADPEELDALWNRAYRYENDIVSLHVLPQTDAANADAIVVILYGFRVLQKLDTVSSTTLMEAAKQSGLRIDRIDRALPAAYNAFVIKGGNGRGSRYSLNNRGLARAQELLEQMFE